MNIRTKIIIIICLALQYACNYEGTKSDSSKMIYFDSNNYDEKKITSSINYVTDSLSQRRVIKVDYDSIMINVYKTIDSLSFTTVDKLRKTLLNKTSLSKEWNLDRVYKIKSSSIDESLNFDFSKSYLDRWDINSDTINIFESQSILFFKDGSIKVVQATENLKKTFEAMSKTHNKSGLFLNSKLKLDVRGNKESEILSFNLQINNDSCLLNYYYLMNPIDNEKIVALSEDNEELISIKFVTDDLIKIDVNKCKDTECPACINDELYRNNSM